MSSLKAYVGRIVMLRPERFEQLVRQARLQRSAPENRFLVASFIGRKGKLVCYGAHLRLLVSPIEVSLV